MPPKKQPETKDPEAEFSEEDQDPTGGQKMRELEQQVKTVVTLLAAQEQKHEQQVKALLARETAQKQEFQEQVKALLAAQEQRFKDEIDVLKKSLRAHSDTKNLRELDQPDEDQLIYWNTPAQGNQIPLYYRDPSGVLYQVLHHRKEKQLEEPCVQVVVSVDEPVYYNTAVSTIEDSADVQLKADSEIQYTSIKPIKDSTNVHKQVCVCEQELVLKEPFEKEPFNVIKSVCTPSVLSFPSGNFEGAAEEARAVPVGMFVNVVPKMPQDRVFIDNYDVTKAVCISSVFSFPSGNFEGAAEDARALPVAMFVNVVPKPPPDPGTKILKVQGG
jgi:hypothetical protein